MKETRFFKFRKNGDFMSKEKHEKQKNKSTHHKKFTTAIKEFKFASHHFYDRNEENYENYSSDENDENYVNDGNDGNYGNNRNDRKNGNDGNDGNDKNDLNNLNDLNDGNDLNDENDLNDRLPKYISASFTLPELPQTTIEDFIFFEIDLILGSEDYSLDGNIIDFKLIFITNENKGGWFFSILSANEDFDFLKASILNPGELVKIVVQADEDFDTSQKAEDCVNWLVKIEANGQPLSSRKLTLKQPTSALVESLHFIASLLEQEDNYKFSKKQIDFHDISIKSFSDKELTPNWEISEYPPQSSSHLDIRLSKKDPSIISIILP